MINFLPLTNQRAGWRWLLPALLLVVLALNIAPPALAFPPPPPVNAHINGTDCDLIDAITAANTDTATGLCAAGTPGADTIELLDNVTLTAANNADIGLPQITSEITINGSSFTIARDPGAPDFRILWVDGSGNLTLNDATVSGGYFADTSGPAGGGILAFGTLTLNNSTVSNNKAASNGGGIASFATLTLNNSTVSGNSGGILGAGGGINTSGTATINNSTISGNSNNYGGGINNTGILMISDSTISDNNAETGGGIATGSGAVATLEHSLVAGNSAPTGNEIYNEPEFCGKDCFPAGVTNADNFNLFGHSGESNAQAFDNFTPGASDISATSDGTTPTALSSILDTTLQDNGGGTATHALVAGSPALDAAPGGPAADQRGVARPQGASFDIGAFELEQIDSGPVCEVVAWGANNSGQAAPPAGLNDALAVSAGTSHSLALKVDGTVVGWGFNGSGQTTPPAGLSNAVAIAAAGSHSLALKADGTVVGWGFNGSGQTTPPAGLSNVVAIATGFDHSLALKADGTVVGWGSNLDGQATTPAGLSNVVAIAAGSGHSLALKADGTVVGWGSSSYGQATPPAGLSNAIAIAAGNGFSLALKADGTVVGWGSSFSGESTPPAGLSDVVAIAAGTSHSLALKGDGTVVGWGSNSFGKATPPAGLGDVSAIAGGFGHSLAVISECGSTNNPPIANAGPDQTVFRNETVTVSGTWTDPEGAADNPYTWSWDLDGDAIADDSGTANDGDTIVRTTSFAVEGVATLTFTVTDKNGATHSDTVDITVVNRAPIADDQSVSTDEDTAVPITLTASDADGDTLTYSIVTLPTNGTLSGTAPNLTYTPNANYFGSDSFTFQANDGLTDSNIATVSITINSVNDPVVAVDDSYTTDEDTAVDLFVLSNDSAGPSNEDQQLTVVGNDSPQHGFVLLYPGGMTYIPDQDYNGSDSFDYTVCDSEGSCDTATVTVLVEMVNDPPTANDDSVTTDEDMPVTFNVLTNDSDPDGNLDASSVTVVSGVSNGTLTDNGSGSFTYTPDANFFGSDSFTYQVCDSDGVCDSAIVSITVNPVNDAPACSGVTPSISELWPPNHQFVPITFTGATDIEGDAITMSVTSIFQDEPTNGTGDGDTGPDGQGIGSSTAEVRAERQGGGNGRYYHITISASDGSGGSCSATVQVSVPKNQGKKGAAVDDGPLYDSTQP